MLQYKFNKKNEQGPRGATGPTGPTGPTGTFEGDELFTIILPHEFEDPDVFPISLADSIYLKSTSIDIQGGQLDHISNISLEVESINAPFGNFLKMIIHLFLTKDEYTIKSYDSVFKNLYQIAYENKQEDIDVLKSKVRIFTENYVKHRFKVYLINSEHNTLGTIINFLKNSTNAITEQQAQLYESINKSYSLTHHEY